MAATLVEAHDALITAVLLGWKRAPEAAGDTGKYSYIVNMVDPDGVPNAPLAGPWCRINAVHSTGTGTSVSRRRYDNLGTLFVQIFVPENEKGAKAAATKAQKIAQSVSDGLKEYRGLVDLTSIRFNDAPKDGPYFRADVLCQFRWIQVRSGRYGG